MAPAGSPTLSYDPYRFSVHDNPYETYRRLRDEAPAYRNDELDFWVLSRFDDVLDGFRDPATFSSAGGIALENRRPIDTSGGSAGRMMIELDPPEHTALRKLVMRVFTPKSTAAMEAEIRRIVDRRLDEVIERGELDLVADFSSPFPMDVISAVLGIPETDRAALRRLSDLVLTREDGSIELPPEAAEAMFEMLAYFVDDLARRRDEGDRTGLIGELLDVDVDGRAITEDELLGFCVLFVIAGHETTTKMVANAIELLSRHPDQRAAVSDDPSLIPGAVEEVLRFHNSTQYMHRTLTCDIERHGERMRAGDSVLLLIGSANHDEREFGPTAGEFDIRRRPPRHLAFGYGAHFCLGAALARLEGVVALEHLHRRLGDYEVDHDRKVRFHSSNVTGWESLPVTFTPGRRVCA